MPRVANDVARRATAICSDLTATPTATGDWRLEVADEARRRLHCQRLHLDDSTAILATPTSPT